MVELDEVRFSYAGGPFSLAIGHLTIAAGERVAFVGPSGSGKTTLLNLIAGISLPDSGRIATAGYQTAELSEPARRDFRIRNIGLVFQEFELLDYLDVLDNVLVPYRIGAALMRSSPGKGSSPRRSYPCSSRLLRSITAAFARAI